MVNYSFSTKFKIGWINLIILKMLLVLESIRSTDNLYSENLAFIKTVLDTYMLIDIPMLLENHLKIYNNMA